jgi:hypothetical protein
MGGVGDWRAQISGTGFQCSRCAYDLSGTPVGGSCPECGQRVEQSLRAGAGQRSSGRAVACMVLGILSLAVCAVFGPVAIFYYFSAMNEIEQGGYSGGARSMAKAGLIMGIISTAIGAVAGLFLLGGLVAS